MSMVTNYLQPKKWPIPDHVFFLVHVAINQVDKELCHSSILLRNIYFHNVDIVHHAKDIQIILSNHFRSQTVS